MKKITGELQSGHAKRECLLRQVNSVSSYGSTSFEERRLAWEVRALFVHSLAVFTSGLVPISG